MPDRQTQVLGTAAGMLSWSSAAKMSKPRSSKDARQTEELAALDRVVRCMVRAREELTACIWTESERGIDFRIAQLRAAREVFQQRLIDYRDHDRR